MFEVVGGEQDLGGVVAQRRECPFVGLHQQALPDGGHGLQAGQIGGPRGHAQAAHARAHRPGADQHDLPPACTTSCNCRASCSMRVIVERAVVARQDLRADFDDERPGEGGDFLAEDVGHGFPQVLGNRIK